MLDIKIFHTGPYGVNSLVVPVSMDSKDVFVVDPGACKACGDENLIFDYIKNNSLNVVAVVLTHGHFDHVSGLKNIVSQFPGVPVLIHEEDSELIGKKGSEIQREYLAFMGILSSRYGNPELIAEYENLPEATEYLSAGCQLSFSADWKTIHTPGHTPGCCCIYNEKEKVLISGDTIFYHSWGRTDLPGGNETQMRQSLTMLGTIIPSDVKVYPGHDRTGFNFGD